MRTNSEVLVSVVSERRDRDLSTGIAIGRTLRHLVEALKAWCVPDLSKYSMILLYMRTVDGSLKMRHGRSIWTLFFGGAMTFIPPKEGAPQRPAPVPEKS